MLVLILKSSRGRPLPIKLLPLQTEELSALLDKPWNDNAERNMELFHEIGSLHGVESLISNLLYTDSTLVIRNMSVLLAYVEEYKDEIAALYLWIGGVTHALDKDSIGVLTTAIQRHIATLDIKLPMAPAIEPVMIPFLLKRLTEFDWTTRDAAILSFDMLDGLRQLDQWLTPKQLVKLQENLLIHLQLEEEQGNTPDIGRLRRFVEG